MMVLLDALPPEPTTPSIAILVVALVIILAIGLGFWWALRRRDRSERH